jgi:hypothetical protein
MLLIDDVRAVCERLGPSGWTDLMAAHGVDLTVDDLAAELARPLPAVDRSLPGFEDFALEGVRGVEPGRPARSLLYHALSSASVVSAPDGSDLGAFPTAAEIDAVENYVYGVGPPSLAEVLARAGSADTAIVVFATEYRPAVQTPHRRHADVCLARTGVARVGTAPAHYDGRRRGFVPTVDGDVHGIRVLPARYAVYLAVRIPGSEPDAVPMRFRVPDAAGGELGDAGRQFWVPLHKLFDGQECLRGRNLHVEFHIGHVNEKLRRVHLALGADASWKAPEVDEPPFRFADGIADLAADLDLPPGVVMPVVHPRLVEPAEFRGKPLTFLVPANEPLSSSFNIPATGARRRGPEYVHVRHVVHPSGAEEDLNDRADVVEVVAAGGYRARHYVDFTGDGWVAPVVPELAVEVPRVRNAYSLVAAADYFPTTDQREVTEWADQQVPSAFRAAIWRIPPDPLSDTRLPANLQLDGGGFRSDDDTVTAIVVAPVTGGRLQTAIDHAVAERHTHLPDDAAGVFAPGWDISVDGLPGGPDHLAAYGLGSPFPEDSKLCAALSSFWPAVAPDASRTFAPSPIWPTVTPLTDEEIGTVGDLPWDGIPGPRLVDLAGKQVVEYRSLAHADYVRSALDGRFSLARTAQVADVEYQARTLAMVRAYAALGVDLTASFSQVVRDKARWTVLSFRSVELDDVDATQAVKDTDATLHPPLFRIEVFTRGAARPAPDVVGRVHVPVRRLVHLLVDPVTVLLREADEPWRTAPG